MNVESRLLLASIFVVMLLSISFVSAEKIILVSDNDADLGVASAVASELNYTIVITQWGQFEESRLQSIIDRRPDEVMIFGGNKAVVNNYENSLLSNSLNFERLGGQTRQQTSLRIYERLREREQLRSQALICFGGSPVLTNDTIPVYYYNNHTEMLEFMEQNQNRLRITNQNETNQLREKFGLTAVDVTNQMREKTSSMLQAVKSNSSETGCVEGQQVSAIVSTHGQEAKESARKEN